MMSEEILESAIEKFRNGDLKGAVDELESKTKEHPDVAMVHHTYAEFANMLNTCLLYTSPSPPDVEE